MNTPVKNATARSTEALTKQFEAMRKAASAQFEALIAREIEPLKREIASLRADLDAFEDAAAIRVIETAADEERFPASVAEALVAGQHPIRVFRKYRKMTQAELAEAAGTTSAYISQIENGDRDAGKKLLPKLADALGVDIEDLA